MLVFLLIVSWFRTPRSAPRSAPRYKSLLGRESGELREPLYERMWREEEEALWDWLDERVGLPEHLMGAMKESRQREADESREGALGMPVGLKDEVRKSKSMSERELEWAIDVTEEKLRILRDSMKKDGKKKVPDPTEAARTSASAGAPASSEAVKASEAANGERVGDEL